MSVSSKQATGTLHRHLNLSPDLFRASTSTEGVTAQFEPHTVCCSSANHSRTSSSSSLHGLVGFSSSSGESSGDELPELESIEDGAVGCRKCRPFPTSNGCRPCRFSWSDLDLDPAARPQRAFGHSMEILSNDYCPLVAGGTRDFVMYRGARCYNQRRRADTGYDVLDYVKSVKRFKTKPSLNISVEEYLRYCYSRDYCSFACEPPRTSSAKQSARSPHRRSCSNISSALGERRLGVDGLGEKTLNTTQSTYRNLTKVGNTPRWGTKTAGSHLSVAEETQPFRGFMASEPLKEVDPTKVQPINYGSINYAQTSPTDNQLPQVLDRSSAVFLCASFSAACSA